MIVLDANAAFAISMGLPEGNALSTLLLEEEEIIAPRLLCAELTHTLAKYVRGNYMNAEEAAVCGRDALLLIDRFVDDSSLWLEAMNESIRLDHSSYDMFYYILALRENATLFTLDRRLQDLCAKTGVNCIEIAEF